MNFYTYARHYGDKILVRGVKEGRRFKTKQDFRPTLFVKSDKPSKYKSIYGENVSPIEIENILSLNENISEVTVVGLPDPKWGQKVCAFVVRNKNLNGQLLDEYCIKSNMLNFKRPKEYIFVKEIPKSPTGKILRRKLVAGEYELD